MKGFTDDWTKLCLNLQGLQRSYSLPIFSSSLGFLVNLDTFFSTRQLVLGGSLMAMIGARFEGLDGETVTGRTTVPSHLSYFSEWLHQEQSSVETSFPL